jgi:hypothetical protein
MNRQLQALFENLPTSQQLRQMHAEHLASANLLRPLIRVAELRERSTGGCRGDSLPKSSVPN